MKVHAGIEFISATNSVVTIGMFDGLHLGHRLLIGETIAIARRQKAQAVVVTFWPHPRLVLGKDNGSLRFLTSLEERTLIFSQLGIDHLVIVPFDMELAALTARQFIEQLLVPKLRMSHLVVGFNHRFGRDGHMGDAGYEAIGNELNFSVTRVGAVTINNEKASSSAIRLMLEKGNVAEANELLGYFYTVTGRVVGGQRLGRTIGYPTANVEVEETAKLIPLDGVYACSIHVLGREWRGMLNIGFRPSISMHLDSRTIEVHIFDFAGDIYSEEVSIAFIKRIRPEMKFNGIDELRQQLKSDEQTVRALFLSNTKGQSQ